MIASDNKLSNIIKLSSELMGFTEKDLSLLLGKELSFYELQKEKLSITSYMKITEFYLLSEIDLFSSYNQEWQVNRICKAILEGEYIHKPTPLIKRHLKAHRRKRWREESTHYGFRLRWQTRINRIFNTNIRIPSAEEIFPFWLRKLVYRIKKTLAIRVHIFKHGNYKDFCYFDRRYDSEEECRVSYYEELFTSKEQKTCRSKLVFNFVLPTLFLF